MESDGWTDRQTYNTSCKVALTTENDLNTESQIFPYFSLISALKEENKIVLTKMAPGLGIRVKIYTRAGVH